MALLPLEKISMFDNGDNTPDSFFVGPLHHGMQDFVRLVADLLLMTRRAPSHETPVIFSDLPNLIELASQRMSRRVDEIAANLRVLETPLGLIWLPKNEDRPGSRMPTPIEVADFEGESRIAYDGVSGLGSTDARLLLAAWGVYCCERAMRAMEPPLTLAPVAALVASAGALLGHANWLEAYATVKGGIASERRSGGLARLVKDPTASAKQAAKQAAHKLWIERNEGLHPNLRTVEQFAIEVMRCWPILTSAKVICGWSSNWTKQVKANNPVF